MARNKTKFRKPNKTKPDASGRERRNSSKDYSNNPEWYATSPELLRDAASIPFSQAAGTFYEVVPDNPETVPGILAYRVLPIVGAENSPNAPVNIAATSTYSFVRHANSGSANYDSPDLMTYIMAVAQIYSYINYLQRGYGTMNLYSHANRYLPKALLTAMRIDFSDAQQSLANFRYGINSLIYKAASLACPANMPYFKRLAFLFSGLYSEGESVKSQLYLNVPAAFFKYSDTATETGGSLQYTPFPSDAMTVKQLIEFGNSLLDPILSSEDMNIMSGDILKAYGDNILKLAPVDENYVVMPIPDLTVLEQMQNADLINTVSTARIVQNTGTASSGPYLNAEVYLENKATSDSTWFPQIIYKSVQNHMLTTILTHPEAPDVIERTRGMVAINAELDSENHTRYRVLSGSDIYTSAYIYKYEYNSSNALELGVYRIRTDNYMPEDDTSTSGVTRLSQYEQWHKIHCLAENFKFHPRMMYFQGITRAGNPPVADFEYMDMALDIDNYAIISKVDLMRMNEAALLSLLAVPSIARFQ